jgi:hypothetical protein
MNLSEIGQSIREACQSAAEVTTVYTVLQRTKSITRNPEALLQLLEAFGAVPLLQ